MLVHHGTTSKAAELIIPGAGPPAISVGLGGGELGRGFYTTSQPAIAAAWANGYFGAGNAAILEGNLDVGRYVALSQVVLNWNQVYNTWMQLRYQGAERTHTFGSDVVYGPLATYSHADQHKFESRSAEVYLNAQSWRVM